MDGGNGEAANNEGEAIENYQGLKLLTTFVR